MLTISQANSKAEITAIRELMREYATWAFRVATNRQPGKDSTRSWRHYSVFMRHLQGVYY